jgi:enamine deaminase RidA (YjgF/YER057c/UK114 family)
VSFDDARRAAQVCILRALAAVRQTAGSLDRVAKLLRMTVYVQSADDFERHSEVADAASDILYALFGEIGRHTRTSVGVYKLPKNAAVEIDLIVALDSGARAQD